MSVLVVGGAGYIGGAVTDELIRRGIDFTVYDNLMYEDIYLKPIDLIVDDVRNTKALGKIINDFDTVIWLAAIVGDGACVVNPELTTAVNEESVKWLRQNYDGKIIFMSTCSVYGANNDKYLDETTPTNPLSLYAGTKCECEKILSCSDATIFRLGTVHGKGDNFSRVRLDLVVNILTLKACMCEPLTVFGGEQWRPIIHVRDIGEAVVNTVEGKKGWGQLNGIFNLTDNNVMIKDLAAEIQSVLPDISVTYIDKKFEDLRNYHVTSKKLYEATGWQPKITLKETILELKDMFTSKRIKDVNTSVYNNERYLRGE